VIAQSKQPLERLYDVEEAAAALRKSHWTVRRDIKVGKIRCLRVGNKILIEHHELARLLDAARDAGLTGVAQTLALAQSTSAADAFFGRQGKAASQSA
jgi:excisionase family DNA binding protein